MLLVGLFLSLAWVDDKQLPHDAGALQHASSMQLDTCEGSCLLKLRHVTVWQASRTTEYWRLAASFISGAAPG